MARSSHDRRRARHCHRRPVILLEAVAAEIEAFVGQAGWDRPPALFALVPTRLLAADPAAAAVLASGSGPDEISAESLTPVAQEELPDGPLDEALAQIGWPDEVLGCALSQEIVMLPPSAEPELDDLAVDRRRPTGALAHPDRREARLVVAVLRDGRSASILRLRGTADSRRDLLTGPDLAPNLVAALERHSRRLTAAARSRSELQPRRGSAVRYGAAAGQRVQIGDRLVQRCHLDDLQPGRDVAPDVGAVARRRQEHRRAGPPGGDHLQRDAADLADLAGRVDGAGAGDEPAVGQVVVADLVDDAEREHQAGRRAADAGQAERHLERQQAALPTVMPSRGVLLPAAGRAEGDRHRRPGLPARDQWHGSRSPALWRPGPCAGSGRR